MAERWYRDRAAWRFVALRYLPVLALLSLGWEWAHVRLYSVWTQATLSRIALYVLHCTVGDVLIGAATLMAALTLARERHPGDWRNRRIAALSAAFGVGYTAFSEWLNVAVLGSWSYAGAMPTLRLGGFNVGVTPLLQWLVIPPLALLVAQTIQRTRS